MYNVEQQLKVFDTQEHHADVCVVGGGLAGLCAAVASARGGAKTVLIHDRPVLGGNASSEVRMWVVGAQMHGGAEVTETGILEEINLDNYWRNPQLIYSIWDSVLYEKAAFCPNLTLLLNASVNGGRMEGGRLASVTAWQLTSQIQHTVHARYFIDCSGDSVLAPITGARVRIGRESRAEFGESIAPVEADTRTMGNSLLLQFRETEDQQSFVAPHWAYKFRSPEELPTRFGWHGCTIRTDNFWWVEIGGLNHSIRDAEVIRDELMKIGYGVADYIKNYYPGKAGIQNWALEWIGSLPGKRENIRYVGEHVLTQNDVQAGGDFADRVAYGGWPMDDHHPAGLLYPGHPTIFHRAPCPYGIPFRSLYSKSVPNLLFAGRNISATHSAMASTRVMATTSLMGQAVGTAAALCVRGGYDPAALFPTHIAALQQQLMDDDILLPGLLRSVTDLTRSASLSGAGTGLEAVRDGYDRAKGKDAHAWEGALGEGVTFSWKQPEQIGGLRLVFDSDLGRVKRMPCSYPRRTDLVAPPPQLIRQYRVEAQGGDGSWQAVARETDNHQRLVRLPLGLTARAIRVVPEATWGAEAARIFSIDVLREQPACIGSVPEGERWAEVVARTPEADLRPTAVKHAARIIDWQCSTPQAKPVRTPARLSDTLGWTAVKGDHEGFVNVHERFPSTDGIVFLAARIRVTQAGTWVACLGHDGGAEIFVDGRSALHQPVLVNPAKAGRSRATLDLAAGEHELVVALDLADGKGWGIYFHLERAEDSTAGELPTVLPLAVPVYRNGGKVS